MIEEKYEVHPEIAAAMPQPMPQIEEPIQEQEAPQQQEQQVASQPTAEEINWRAIREKERRLERERDEALRLAEELKSRAQKAPEEPEELAIGNDDIVEGKHLSKVQKELRKIKEELNQYKQYTSQQTAETRLKSQYPDFDRVVNKDTIETLKYAYPELYNTLSSSTDVYSTGVSAYTLIKKFNIDQPYAADAEKAEKNIVKPKPTNSISPQRGDNALSRANAFAEGLTEDLKKQLVKEMNEYRRGY